jgi:hypothetical protein
MRNVIAILVLAAAAAAILTEQQAGAMKPFFEQFKSMYVKPESKERSVLIFNAAVEKKGCTICHKADPKTTPGPKTFNAYGEQVKKYLTKKDKDNPGKIRSALAKVSKLRSNPDDSKSLTFGERIHSGKLPVGEIHVRTKDAAQDNPAQNDPGQKGSEQ